MKIERQSMVLSYFSRLVALALATGSAEGAALFWDGGSSNIGTNGNGASTGGSGTWSTAIQNWDAGAASPHVAWLNGNDAVFAGAAGTVTLGTVISAGTILISNSNYTIATPGGTTLTLTSGITTVGNYHEITDVGGLVLSGAQAFNITGGMRISTSVSGSGNITKTGAGFVSFSNSNTGFTGKITVNQGSFGITSDSALGAIPAAFVADSITLNGGSLVSGNVNSAFGSFDNAGPSYTLNANRGITLGSSGGTIQVGYGAGTQLTVAGVITGAGSLTKTDTGTLTLSGANTYTGPTFIRNGGVLNASIAGALPTATRTDVTFDGTGASTLNLGGTAVPQVAASLSSALTTATVRLNANALTVGTASGTATYAGVISGAGGTLTKDRASIQVLTGANTYTGGTTVTAGTLLANNAAGSGTGTGLTAVAVAGTLGGTGTISASASVSGTVAPGDPALNGGIGTLSIAALSLNSGSISAFQLQNPSSYDQLLTSTTTNSGGTLNLEFLPGFSAVPGSVFRLLDSTLTVAAYALSNFGIPADGQQFAGTGNAAGYTFEYDYNNSNTLGVPTDPSSLSLLVLMVVPEPSRALLLLAGVTMLAGRRRRR